MSTALLTILTSKPLVRAYIDGLHSVVATREFCNPETCIYSAHQHFMTASEQILPLGESNWAGEWQYVPVQDTLPFDESDELEQADDAYAVAVGK